IVRPSLSPGNVSGLSVVCHFRLPRLSGMWITSGLPVIRPQSGLSPGAQPVSVYSGVISITQGRLPESAGAIRRLGADPSQSAYEVHGATWYGPGARKSNRPPALTPDIPLCTYSAPGVGVRCSLHLPRDRDHSGYRQTLSSSRVQRV